MRSTLITAVSVILLGYGTTSGAQTTQPNLQPTDPGTDTTGRSGIPARDSQPLPPNYDTRYPREPRVLPTPNNLPLPDPRLIPEPDPETPDQQSGM